MALDKMKADTASGTVKDLYDLGEIPPLGHVPATMHAWAIRRERHGEPDQSFQLEAVDVRKPGSNEVVVLVMAAGVNYNGVWAGPWRSDQPLRRSRRRLPHCRLRRLGHRLGRRGPRQELEGRR